MRPLRVGPLLAALLLAGSGAAAQAWNSDSALALARRAIDRREHAATDTGLRDYKALAHGFVFFLGQFGEGLTEPPRLVKADQLELEVYWKAPGASKQRIVGWRDRADIPTDINYHRDHLGIVQNNFGRSIRIGDGDEVVDVPHPFSIGGPLDYDYALADTQTIVLPQREVRVIAVRVRPKDFAAPRIVGTLYVDAGTADVVRMAFDFTPAAYRDPELEDLSIVLDNALWQGRYWLPYRQEIEIRRRATWLDIPARGIIRGRWEIGDYAFNLGLADSWFRGEEITAVPKAERDSYPWPGPIDAAIQGVAEPVRVNDLEAVRAAAAQIAGERALTGLKSRRLGARGVSDLLHVNRVEGVTPGAGFVWRAAGDRVELRALASYGFADDRAKGALSVAYGGGRGTLEASGYRQVRDVGDVPVIAPLFNSISAQEWGDDYGDYYLATGARLEFRHGAGPRGEWRASLARETIGSLGVAAAPATGRYRANPALGGRNVSVAQLVLRRGSEGFAVRRDLAVEASLEGGRFDGGATYGRAALSGHVLIPVGGSRLLVRAQGGIATAALPPHRAFVLGGRGTLLGDSFRAWGGSRAALVHLEWRVPVPFVSLRAGAYARTPGTITVAPFVASGWADRPVAGTPWRATPGARTTLGVALEWLGALRLEAGYGVESRRAHLSFDVARDFWGVL